MIVDSLRLDPFDMTSCPPRWSPTEPKQQQGGHVGIRDNHADAESFLTKSKCLCWLTGGVGGQFPGNVL